MKKALSFIIAVMMLMQMFTFTVSAASAPATVCWTGEYPGELMFTLVNGVDEYRINVYKDNSIIEKWTHHTNNYYEEELCFYLLEDILEYGNGTYRVEVGSSDGNGGYTFKSSGNFVYNKPSVSLAKATNIKFDAKNYIVTWNAVPGAEFYEVVLGFTFDTSEGMNPYCTYMVDSDNYFDFYECGPEEFEWLYEEIQYEAEYEGLDPDDAIVGISVNAMVYDINDKTPSFSDYVTLDGTIVETPDEEEPTELGNLTWGDEIGVLKFMPASDKDGYYIKLYKDDVVVDETWYFTESYENVQGVEYNNFIYSMVDNGSGEYRFSVCSVDEDLNFNNDIVYSEPYIYNKKTTVAKATNLSYADNNLRWTNTDSNVASYAIAYYLTYDEEEYHQLLVEYSTGDKHYVDQSDMDYFNSTIESWHDSDSNKYDKEKAKIVAAVYSVPSNRNNLEMSKSDYVMLQGKKELVQVDRSSITDGKYADGAKIAYDLGLMTNVYENPTANITKGELCEIVVKMLGAEDVAKSMNSTTSYFSDVQTGTDLNGYVTYLYDRGIVSSENGGVFGASTELLYEQILKVLVGVLGFEPMAQSGYYPYPHNYLYVASKYKITGELVLVLGETVSRQQMTALVANVMQAQTMKQTSWGYQPTYEVTDESLLFKLGYSKITGIGYADQNTLTIDSGTLKDIDNLKGIEVTELEFENYDYDILALNGKDSTYYVKDGKAISGLLNYKASVQINNGDTSTSNRNVTLNLSANGYTKYKIEDGSYFPITSRVSYVLPSVNHGYQSVNVTFANDDETRTQKVSDSIEFINMHKLTYMADGKEFASMMVGCGEQIGYLTQTPFIEGHWFNGWEPSLPAVMPDEDVTVYAKFTPYTTVTGKITYNGEVAANKEVYVLGSTYTTDADGNFWFNYISGIKQMTTLVSNYLSKSVYLDLTGRTFDLGTVDFTRMETTVADSTNLISSVTGLENAFDQEDRNYIDTTVNSVTVNVSVKSAEQTEEITKEVAKNFTDYEVVQNIDIKIEKYQGLNAKEVTETEGLLGFEVALPDESKGKSSYIVLREHEGSVDALTTTPNVDGEYFIVNRDSILIYAKKFSVYSLAATEVVSATKTDTGVSLTINLNEQVVKDSALMIVKAYDKRGVQLASKAIPVTASYSDTITLECEGATGYKLLFFNGLANIKPVYVPIGGEIQ